MAQSWRGGSSGIWVPMRKYVGTHFGKLSFLSSCGTINESLGGVNTFCGGDDLLIQNLTKWLLA